MELPTEDESSGWPGLPITDDRGDLLGECAGVFADAETGVTDWLDVRVPGHGRVLVPALDAKEIDGRVQVRCARALVLSAPRVQAERELMERDEIALYDHYGVAYTDEQSATLLPVGVEIAVDGKGRTPTAGSARMAFPDAGPIAPPAGPPFAPGTAAGTDRQTAAAAPAGPAGTPDLPAPELQVTDRTAPLGALPDPVPQREPRVVPAGHAAPSGAVPPERLTTPRVEAEAVPPPPGPAAGAGAVPPGADTTPFSSALSALTPLAVVVGLAVAVAVGRSARDVRARRRGQPTARLRRTTAQAARVAGRQWDRAPVAVVGARSALADALSWTSQAAARSGRRAVRRTAAAPGSVALGGRRVRRAVVRPVWRGVLVAGFGVGYTAGARAGRERYEHLRATARRLAGSSAVRRSGVVAAQQARRGAAGAAALVRRRVSGRGSQPGDLPGTTL